MSETDGDGHPYERGHVVWHDGLFRGNGRPWFVLSDRRHPFHGEEYIVAGITTTERPSGIELDDVDWVVGGLPRTSYVSPWFLTTLKHTDIDRGVGEVTEETREMVTDKAVEYISGHDGS